MRVQKKGVKGNAALYMTRAKALKKLQVSLAEFRRLCILKGIFPREPKKKVEGPLKTYYLTKDIQYLAQEPLLDKFRQIRVHKRKIRHATSKGQRGHAKLLRKHAPGYTLDHIVRERYPNFRDALKDLDDALCHINLFAQLPSVPSVTAERIRNCFRLSREFAHFVAVTGTLRKVFCSIKGIYYQAEVLGETITWLVPHKFTQELPGDVDYRVMGSFLEFYECLMKFVNFRLYHSQGLRYPPPVDQDREKCGVLLGALKTELVVSNPPEQKVEKSKVDQDSKRIAEIQLRARELANELRDEDNDNEHDDEERKEHSGESSIMDIDDMDDDRRTSQSNPFSRLFSGLVFFLGRETPVWALEFILRSFGGKVGWEGEGSSIEESDPSITHFIVDRPALRKERRMNAEYVQPQWVFDSCNALTLLPPALYGVGAPLPPHLSPFPQDDAEDYRPEFQEYIDRLREGDSTVVFDAVASFEAARRARDAMTTKELAEGSKQNRGDSKLVSRDEEDEHQPGYAPNFEGQEEAVEDNDEDEEVEEDESDDEEFGDEIDGEAEGDEGDSNIEPDPVSRTHRAKVKSRNMKQNQPAESASPVRGKITRRSEKERRELERAKMMMSKKDRRLFDRIEHSKRRKSERVEKLKERRQSLEVRPTLVKKNG
uniref:Pescadillo homolog n=1 Tax=Compsopogon caeruleus TaxID=31354 RepID=A0A7S1TBP7_9RHOD|mmetsp:Transcript_16330/g.33224  ORF Transcript_16330/g.33224 Transcript_16330/m.33224 type:complete len:657 (+) Transcript_16330:746-2716(+)